MKSDDYIEIAKKLYPDENAYLFGSYQPIINHFGTVVLQHDDDNYQGDTWVLYKTPEKFGFLLFGWGSCSVCDALQACENHRDLAQVIQYLESTVRWGTAEELLKYFKEHDWGGDYSRNDAFIEKAIAFIEENPC